MKKEILKFVKNTDDEDYIGASYLLKNSKEEVILTISSSYVLKGTDLYVNLYSKLIDSLPVEVEVINFCQSSSKDDERIFKQVKELFKKLNEEIENKFPEEEEDLEMDIF